MNSNQMFWQAGPGARPAKAADLGTILVAVLVVSLLSSMIALSLLYETRADSAASASSRGERQALAAAMSGVHFVAEVVSRHAGRPEVWHDNSGLFRRQLVVDDGVDAWFFTVFSRRQEVDDSSALIASDTAGVRFGLTDESSKFNVHMLDSDTLKRIPGMDGPRADALRDYLDPPDGPHPEGAEQEYYEELPRPYWIRNNRISTIDELLLVRGFDAADVYGDDVNLNCVLDRNEDDGAARFPPDNGDGVSDPGLRGWLTTWGVGWAVDHELHRQVDLNRDIDRLAELDISDETIRYIAARRRADENRRRQRERREGSASKDGHERERRDELTFHHPVELLDASVTLKKLKKPRDEDRPDRRAGRDKREPEKPLSVDDYDEVELRSGVDARRLAELLDRTRAYPFDRFISRHVNVNTASAEMLALVPDIDDVLAEAIVAGRRELTEEDRRTTAWLLKSGLVDAERFRRIAPWLAARGFQYRMQVVGFGVPSGSYRVLEAIVDVGRDRPRIVYLRDLTRFGLPFPIRVDRATAGVSTVRER